MSARERFVLVLDDDVVVRRNLCAYLEDEGFSVLPAGSGEDALLAVSEHRVDVAVVDIRLPGMNGNDFIHAAHQASPGTAFLVYTGSPDYDLPPSLAASGVRSSGLLHKPLRDMRVLVDAIHRLTGDPTAS